jgi:hypothetical protein
MTNAEFQSFVIAEFGATREELGAIRVTTARIDERQQSQGRHITALQSWQDSHDDKAEQTGRHELATAKGALVARRQVAWSWIGKASLLVVGSLLALAAPACQHLVGL